MVFLKQAAGISITGPKNSAGKVSEGVLAGSRSLVFRIGKGLRGHQQAEEALISKIYSRVAGRGQWVGASRLRKP